MDGCFPLPHEPPHQTDSASDRACLGGHEVWLSSYLQQDIMAGCQDIDSGFC